MQTDRQRQREREGDRDRQTDKKTAAHCGYIDYIYF